jgi:hypothetical protein
MPPIDFRGYAGDCLVHGRLVVPAEARLTDFLNAASVFAVHDTLLYALDDGRAVEVGDQDMLAGELWAVEPTDSGVTPWHADFHVPTRAIRIELDMPPYRITGTLHGGQGSTPAVNRRRRRMIPLTDAEVTFTYMGQEITRLSLVVIINRERVLGVRRRATTASRSNEAVPEISSPA